jgi:hypothetical protein
LPPTDKLSTIATGQLQSFLYQLLNKTATYIAMSAANNSITILIADATNAIVSVQQQMSGELMALVYDPDTSVDLRSEVEIYRKKANELMVLTAMAALNGTRIVRIEKMNILALAQKIPQLAERIMKPDLTVAQATLVYLQVDGINNRLGNQSSMVAELGHGFEEIYYQSMILRDDISNLMSAYDKGRRDTLAGPPPGNRLAFIAALGMISVGAVVAGAPMFVTFTVAAFGYSAAEIRDKFYAQPRQQAQLMKLDRILHELKNDHGTAASLVELLHGYLNILADMRVSTDSTLMETTHLHRCFAIGDQATRSACVSELSRSVVDGLVEMARTYDSFLRFVERPPDVIVQRPLEIDV